MFVILGTIAGCAALTLIIVLIVMAENERAEMGWYPFFASILSIGLGVLIFGPICTRAVSGIPSTKIYNNDILKIVTISRVADTPEFTLLGARRIDTGPKWGQRRLSLTSYRVPTAAVQQFEGAELPITVKAKVINQAIAFKQVIDALPH